MMCARFYPFSAIVNNEHAKKALLCALTDPGIRGVLITGREGTGKSTILTSIDNLTDRKLVTVPQNITEDRLYGSIDIEKALATGKVELDAGILKTADSNLVRLDDMDLLEQGMLGNLMTVVESGKVTVERDGISDSYGLTTTVLATSSKNTASLDKGVLDRFDICVETESMDVSDRMTSLPRELAFQDGDEDFLKRFREEDVATKKSLEKARSIYPGIRLSKPQLQAISEICIRYDIDGYRGELACAKVSKALAALDGRTSVGSEDIVEASVLCLNHRRNVRKTLPVAEEAGTTATEETQEYSKPKEIRTATSESEEVTGNETAIVISDTDPDEERYEKEILLKASKKFAAIDIMRAEDRFGNGGDPRKRVAEASTGRFSGYRIPDEKPRSIAIYPTMREAISHSGTRTLDGRNIDVRMSDVREKVLTQKRKNTFIFMLDSSWSITIRNRMAKVKAAILSMLETHYVNRDKVGLMTFNEESIDLLMEPSRSLDVLSGLIDKIPAGNGTPLSQAFADIHAYLTPYLRKRPNESCHIVLMTDGKATKSIDQNINPIAESLRIASEMKLPNTDWIVIDISIGFTRSDAPRNLAEALGGRFFLLDDLEIKDTVSKLW